MPSTGQRYQYRTPLCREHVPRKCAAYEYEPSLHFAIAPRGCELLARHVPVV